MEEWEERKETLLSLSFLSFPFILSTLFLDDAAWENAPVLSVKLMGGNLIGRVTLEMRAVYTNTDIYVAYRWSDATESVKKAMWVYEREGWRQLGVKRAGEAGNEDRVMVVWDVSIPRFKEERLYLSRGGSPFRSVIQSQGTCFQFPMEVGAKFVVVENGNQASGLWNSRANLSRTTTMTYNLMTSQSRISLRSQLWTMRAAQNTRSQVSCDCNSRSRRNQ